MAREAYMRLAGWKAASDAFALDLFAAAAAVRDEDPDLIRALNPPGEFGQPSAYGGRYPFWQLYRLTSRGMCREADRFMPGELEAEVLVVSSVGGRKQGQSGRSEAEQEAHSGFAAWIDMLHDIGAVRTRCQDFEVSATAAGALDEYTRAMFATEPTKSLWAFSSRVTVTL